MVAKRFWLGIFLGILGVILFSSKAVMIKLAYNYKVDAITMLLLRMLFSFPFYLVIAYLYRNEKKEVKTTKKEYYWIVLFGVIGYYLASYFDFVGLTYITASLERIILFVYPTIVILLNRFFLKQPVTKIQAIAICLSYIGIIIAFSSEVEVSGSNAYLGGFFILLSAITYAFFLVGSGWLIPKFGVVKFTAYTMLVSCVCVFVHFSFIGETDLFNLQWQVYVLGALIAVFATVIPSFLISASIKIISSSNFAIVAGIGPISTIILASFFLNERLTLVQFFGALLVLIGIVISALKKTKK
ncbi:MULTISPECIES: DMT family transporter [unclassified Polaribacter]|uniref:DMT family transporter n=1 Tax=unclassified Polaribacter TaxID=196858 RepID=UPI0011BF0D00|nr:MULTISPECIES: DMT family transporter [unclassified Polaribacter]TXD53508.1 DMT family transporter [Polaribacter sp. IC063]TXD58344.1 DMT family transporter [Polaribacter sp. IC066]